MLVLVKDPGLIQLDLQVFGCLVYLIRTIHGAAMDNTVEDPIFQGVTQMGRFQKSWWKLEL